MILLLVKLFGGVGPELKLKLELELELELEVELEIELQKELVIYLEWGLARVGEPRPESLSPLELKLELKPDLNQEPEQFVLFH